MPFDLVKVATSITLAFLAISLYYTVKESPTFTIYQNVSYLPLTLFLSIIFLAIMPIMAYSRAISDRTKINYWGYLKSGLFIHMAATFYVFALIAILWDGLEGYARILSTLFALSAFTFYLFYALDMRTIITDLEIKFTFKKLDIARYLVSLYSIFFLILFSISFTYQKIPGFSFESYPFILFAAAFFLIAFTTYLSVTHKGFEEIMKKNIWSELSYVSSFGAFILVYLIYTTLKAEVQSFPLRDLFFVGYFAVLLIEIYSIKTLDIKVYGKEEKKDIVGVLNFSARYFLRTDYMETAWEGVIDRYATPENNLERARFSPHSRTFHFPGVDESAKIVASVAMLFEIQRMSTKMNKVTPTTMYSPEALKTDMEDILGERVLLLPEGLRGDFNEEKYYPLLYARVINDLIYEVKAFIPSAEQKTIFSKLARVDSFFKEITFDGSEISLPENVTFSHNKFIEYFKLYVDTVEQSFPFEHSLLYNPIKDIAKEYLSSYNFSLADLTDLVPTGVEKIDEVSDGGLIKRTSTLLIAEGTDTKSEILRLFIGTGIIENDNNVYATSKHPLQELKNALARDFGGQKNTTLIDLYSAINTAAAPQEVVEGGDSMVVPANTTLFQHSVVRAVKKYPRDSHKRVVLDVYDDLLRYYKWEDLSTILYRQVEGFRKWNCTSIVVMDPNFIPEEKLGELKKHFDSVISLRGTGKNLSMIVDKLYGGTPTKQVIPLYG